MHRHRLWPTSRSIAILTIAWAVIWALAVGAADLAVAQDDDMLEERLATMPQGPFDGVYRGEVTISVPSCGEPSFRFGVVNSHLVLMRPRPQGAFQVRTLNGTVGPDGRIQGTIVIGQYTYPFSGTLREGTASGFVPSRKVFCNGNLYDADVAWEARLVESRAAVEARRQAPGDAPAQEAARGDKAAPEIAAPESLTAAGSTVTIEGRVSDDSTLVEFTVNGSAVALDADGRFAIKRGVATGTSKITLAATDEWGNQATHVVSITRSAASAEKTGEIQGNADSTERPAPDSLGLSLSLGRFVALIIGNDKYQHLPALKTATRDAAAIAALLETRYGFKTTLLRNATRRDVLAALADLRSKLTYEDNLLIYYAGHGQLDEVTERGYWLPVDAEEGNPANWISNADVTDMLKALPSRAVLVIADSCYSGTLTRSIAPVSAKQSDRKAFLERVAGKRARTVLASGGLEPVVDSGGGKHSVFAKALLDVLSENNAIIDAQSLFAPIRERVILNAEQTPEYADVRLAGHEGGEFIFVPR